MLPGRYEPPLRIDLAFEPLLPKELKRNIRNIFSYSDATMIVSGVHWSCQAQLRAIVSWNSCLP